MKVCDCGGMWHRHGRGSKPGDERYRCAACHRVITVRNGQIVKTKTGPRVADWRTQTTEATQ